MNQVSRIRLPSFPALAFFGLLLLTAFLPALQKLALNDPDSFWHLRLGEEILRARALPPQEILTFTHQGLHYLQYEWGAQVILAALHRFFGVDAFVFFAALLGALTGYLLLRRIFRLGAEPLSALASLGIVALILSTGFVARPHLFTWVGFSLGVAALEQGLWRKRHWSVPVSFWAGLAVWVNLHPACLAFLGLLGIEFTVLTVLAFRRRGPWGEVKWAWMIFVCAALGYLTNPYGWRIGQTVLGFVTERGFNELIVEHQPLLAQPHVALGALFTLIYAVLGLRRIPSEKRPFEWARLAVLGVLAISANRHAQLFAISSCGLMALGLQSLINGKGRSAIPPSRVRSSYVSDWAWLGMGVTLLVAIFAWAPRPYSLRVLRESSVHPIKAVDFLRAQPSSPGTRVFNAYSFGGYLEYALPELRTFIDGRAEFFGYDFVQQMRAVEQSPDEMWKVLNRYQVDWAILQAGSRMGPWLEEAGWRRLYADGQAVILAQRDGLR